MGNCCRPFCESRGSERRNKTIVLLLVGLDNAGKTSAAKNLMGESLESVVPTVGFSAIPLTYRDYSVKIYDLGGGPQIRGIWHRYFADVHGIMFVVDSSDVPRLDETRDVLREMLTHEKLAGKPVLLLANKQDCEGALDELDIVEHLNLEALVNEQRCPTMVETCSTTQIGKRKVDPAIHNGYTWLLNHIIQDYGRLNGRVTSDTAEQKKLDDADRELRRQRVTLLRRQRGRGDERTDDEENGDGDPFRPIAVVAGGGGGEGKTGRLDPIVDTRVILVKESPRRYVNVDGRTEVNSSGDARIPNADVNRNNVKHDVVRRQSPVDPNRVPDSDDDDVIPCQTEWYETRDGNILLVRECPRGATSDGGRISATSDEERILETSDKAWDKSPADEANMIPFNAFLVKEARDMSAGRLSKDDVVPRNMLLVRDKPQKKLSSDGGELFGPSHYRSKSLVKESQDKSRKVSSVEGNLIPQNMFLVKESQDKSRKVSSDEGNVIPHNMFLVKESQDKSRKVSSDEGNVIPHNMFLVKESQDKSRKVSSDEGNLIPQNMFLVKESQDKSRKISSDEGNLIPHNMFLVKESKDKSRKVSSDEGNVIPHNMFLVKESRVKTPDVNLRDKRINDYVFKSPPSIFTETGSVGNKTDRSALSEANPSDKGRSSGLSSEDRGGAYEEDRGSMVTDGGGSLSNRSSLKEYVKDQLELDNAKMKRKRRLPLRRSNKTAPLSTSSDSSPSHRSSDGHDRLSSQTHRLGNGTTSPRRLLLPPLRIAPPSHIVPPSQVAPPNHVAPPSQEVPSTEVVTPSSRPGTAKSIKSQAGPRDVNKPPSHRRVGGCGDVCDADDVTTATWATCQQDQKFSR